ncbi:hypothetical protein U0070_016284 [Myodes glareolus]|uniref:Large ribosomal subunit protein bL9m n=1 Tax=Myodes glareolus TaxID=447135 RepID=A0AAW0HEJ8_MYOGA
MSPSHSGSPGLSRTCSSATQARRGQPRGPDCACAGPFLRLRAGAGVMAASVASRGRALLRAGSACLRQGSIGELLRARMEGGTPGRDFSLSHYRVTVAGWRVFLDARSPQLPGHQSTVIVERWWKVPLAGEGRKPLLHRRHRVYKLLEDTKHRPKDLLELILTQSVDEIGVRGDLVLVKKSVGRNKLLSQGLAVYASPENKKLFEEEKLLRQEGKLEKIQTKAGEATVKFLRSCHLEVGMKNNVQWELNPEIVARHFFKNVNGLDTVRVPMSVVLFQKPKTKRYKRWLAQQAAKSVATTSSQAA